MDAVVTAVGCGFGGKIFQKGVENGRFIYVSAISLESSIVIAGATEFIICVL